MKTEYCDIRYLNSCLLNLVGESKFIRPWWEANNMAFNGRKPYEVYLYEPDGQRQVASYILGCIGGSW